MNKTCQIKVSVAPDKLSTINNSTILEIKKELCIFSVCLKGCIAQADESSQGQVAVVDKAINLCAVCAYGQGPTINRTLPVFLQFLTSKIEMELLLGRYSNNRNGNLRWFSLWRGISSSTHLFWNITRIANAVQVTICLLVSTSVY